MQKMRGVTVGLGKGQQIRSAMVAIFTVRVMSACGAVKWFGSPNWRRLTAMPTHYLTQPSPTPLGALAYAYLPRSFHRFSTAVTLILEGPLGPLALAGRRARVAVFAGYAALLAMINLCGNYGFLGLMWLRRIAQLEQGSSADASLEDTATSVTGAAAWGWLAAVPYLVLSTVHLLQSCNKTRASALCPPLRHLERLHRHLEGFRICNFYGKFGHVLPTRHEAMLEYHWEVPGGDGSAAEDIR
eukprot:gene9793-biopygen9998